MKINASDSQSVRKAMKYGAPLCLQGIREFHTNISEPKSWEGTSKKACRPKRHNPIPSLSLVLICILNLDKKLFQLNGDISLYLHIGSRHINTELNFSF